MADNVVIVDVVVKAGIHTIDKGAVLLHLVCQKRGGIHDKLFGIAGYISAVSPERVKIHKIYKAESVKIPFCDFDGLFHALYGTFGLVGFCQSLAVKNIINLADRDDVKPCIFKALRAVLP